MSESVGYALSAQQRAAFADGTPGTVAVSVALSGVSASTAAERLTEAAARHEVFASTLTVAAALREPVQLVHEASGIVCEVRSEAGTPESVLDELSAGIDAGSGPVLRAVVTPTPEGCALALAASAMFADVRTLTDLAAVVATGRVGEAGDEEPIQYAEYAAYQADLLADGTSPDAATATGVWARLSDPAGTPGGTRLPVLSSDADGSAAAAPLVTETSDPSTGPDPLAWWLSRWLVAVSRLTGEREITLGVEMDPRENPELAGAAGPYSRVVPLTFDVPVSGALAELSAQVADALARARTWIEWAPPLSAPPYLLVSSGPSGARSHSDPARIALQVELRVDDEATRAVALAGPSGTPSMARRAAEALTRIVTDGAQRLEDLDILDATDLGPAPTVPERLEPVVNRVLAHATTRPDHVALTDGRDSLTYAQLAARVDRLSGALVHAAHDGPVAVRMPRSIDALVAMLAAQRAGLGYVALDVDGPSERAVQQAELAGSRVWVTSEQVPAGAVEVAVTAAGPEVELPEVGPSDLAYVLFTSGSTGTPKGVAIGQDSLAGYAEGVVPVIEAAAGRLGADLVWGQVTGLTTDLGNTAIYGALASGGTLHVVPSEVLQDPDALSRHLAAHPVDVLKITPTHLRALLSDVRADVLPREVLVLGGEALTCELVDLVRERGRCRIVNHYGPTETTVGALTFFAADGTGAPPRAPASTVPIGRPLAGYEALVVDERLRLVPPGAVGELLVGGVGVARGYVNDEAATAASFVEHPTGPACAPTAPVISSAAARTTWSRSWAVATARSRYAASGWSPPRSRWCSPVTPACAAPQSCCVATWASSRPWSATSSRRSTRARARPTSGPTWLRRCRSTWCPAASWTSTRCPCGPTASSTSPPCRCRRRCSRPSSCLPSAPPRPPSPPSSPSPSVLRRWAPTTTSSPWAGTPCWRPGWWSSCASGSVSSCRSTRSSTRHPCGHSLMRSTRRSSRARVGRRATSWRR